MKMMITVCVSVQDDDNTDDNNDKNVCICAGLGE